MNTRLNCFVGFVALIGSATLVHTAQADLLAYWSADSTEGRGDVLPNDQGNHELDGELVNAPYSSDGEGHTGQPGDYAVFFEGFDDDYAVIPPFETTFDEITITGWINGISNGAWAGIVVSRDPSQPIYLGFHGSSMELAYVWNDNSSETWGWQSGVAVEPDEWNFVAMTVTEEAATLYSGLPGGELDFNSNEIDHFPQDSFHEWRWAEDDCCGGSRNFAGLMDDVAIWDEALTVEQIRSIYRGAKTPLTLFEASVPGDFNENGERDPMDLDLLADAMSTNDLRFDLDGNGKVDYEDRLFWVEQLANTYIGDSNFDGEFNSSDFVVVFTAAKYETEQPATWTEGDWNGDKKFSSSDFVVAFQGQGYERGPREGGLQVVPEPAGWLIAIGFLPILLRPRKMT